MTASRSGSAVAFFVLVFILSVPFWLVGGIAKVQLLPGLPVSALSAVCPLVSALILVYKANSYAGATALLRRSFDCRRIRAKLWYAPLLLLMPAINLLAYGLMRVTGAPLPEPRVSVLAAPVLFFVFFLAALGEELGWSGYVIDRLQPRWGACRASILLGSVCAAWHIVPLLQVNRSPQWIAWWCLFTVAGRVLHTWLYNNTGKSVFGMAVFHATSNTSWQLFPNNGSHYDPKFTGFIVAITAAIVTIVWGPQTLIRRRNLCDERDKDARSG